MTPADLRAWRVAHGLTQARFAAMLGMPQATLENIEQGRRPNSALLGPLSKLLPIWDKIGLPEDV